MLAIAAACAISACGGGSQHLTPATGGGLTPASAGDRAVASQSQHEDGDGGNDNGDGLGGTVAYSSVPKPVHAVASVGFEAYQGLQLGDGVNLTRTGKLLSVRYVLSSWGCQSGHWYAPFNCVTTGHPTFAVPFTLNVYAVSNTNTSRVGPLLATQTRTFNIPYRPSADNVRCTGANAGKFYSAVDARCVNGLANVITFQFAPTVTVPLQSIYSLVYNTSHYGPNPIGESAPCYTSSGGCGYDSLNISTDGPGGPIGSPIDPTGVFWSSTNAAQYCNPLLGLGFRLDSGCWTGYHPQFEVRVSSGRGDDRERGHDD